MNYGKVLPKTSHLQVSYHNNQILFSIFWLFHGFVVILVCFISHLLLFFFFLREKIITFLRNQNGLHTFFLPLNSKRGDDILLLQMSWRIKQILNFLEYYLLPSRIWFKLINKIRDLIAQLDNQSCNQEINFLILILKLKSVSSYRWRIISNWLVSKAKE